MKIDTTEKWSSMAPRNRLFKDQSTEYIFVSGVHIVMVWVLKGI